MEIPKANAICCAIRGHPQLGFRCFMSTTAAITSWLGPLGPASPVESTRKAGDISAESARDAGSAASTV
jgi:hypothetical protein